MNKFQFSQIIVSTLLLCFFTTTKSLAQCAITDLMVTVSDCDANDKFSADITFNFTETGTNGFQILGNGNNYGTFQYADLPISIEDLVGNCEIEYEFIVRDVIDPTCAAFLDYGTVCCDDICEIAIFDFEAGDCFDNSSFSVSFDLEYGFVGEDGFSVTINGESFGDFSYEDLPLNIDEVSSDIDEVNSITICDIVNPECCFTQEFLNPCVCTIANITSTIVDCNILDSVFFTIIDFVHAATNDSFQMGYSNSGINTFLGVFAYTDLPVTVGPIIISDSEKEILIVDTDNFFCFNSAYLGIVEDCNIECQIFNVFGEAYSCEEGEYFMDVEFEAKDLSGSTFDIIVDDINYGTFEYGENFYTVGPIPSDCEIAPTLVVQDSGQEICSDFYNLPEPICCLPDCNFTAFEASSECGATTLTVNGTFDNNGIMLSSFYFVEILGTSYGPFTYGDFTFSIEIPLLPNGEYEATINDSMDPECQISTFFLAQCDGEPCMIFDVSAEAGECEDNLFFVDVEFQFEGAVSDSFTILGNGNTYGTFAYGESFYTVGPLEGDCETVYEFFVSDQILEGCNAFFEFEEPICCGIGDCILSDLEILEYTCNDADSIESFTLNFFYESVSSDMFALTINGENLGSYLYSDLPIPFTVGIPRIFEIQVQDPENEECQTSQEFELECINTGECNLDDATTTIVDCSDDLGVYFLELEATSIGTNIEIYISDTLNAVVSYSDLPYSIGPLNLGELHEIYVKDSGDAEGCIINFPTELEICQTGLDEAFFSNTNILQTPNEITIENNELEDLTIQLISTTGALVGKMKVDKSLSKSFDTSSFKQGLYFMNITNGRSQKTIKIFVY